jgi:hypothetical protein
MGSEAFHWRHLAPKREQCNVYMAIGFRVAEDKKQDRKFKYNVTLSCLSATIFSVESTKYYTSKYVSVALVIQHAMRMCHIVFCGLSGCTIFYTLFHKLQNFRKKNFWK